MHSIFREPINALTHLAGAVLAFIALIAMVVKASLLGSPLAIMAAILFGISLVFLYLSSGLYHSIIASPNVIAFFRRIDHAMIYALIAGTSHRSRYSRSKDRRGGSSSVPYTHSPCSALSSNSFGSMPRVSCRPRSISGWAGCPSFLSDRSMT